MKLQLNTKLFPQYNPLVSLAERKEKAAEEAKKEAEEKAVQELYDSLESINSFALGTTPNFTIDLNKDLLKLEDIDQLIVTFGQFGQVVQREILYFSDNYKLDYDLVQDDDGAYEYNYKPMSAALVTDEKDIFDDNIQFKPSNFYEDDENNLFKKEGCMYEDPTDGRRKRASRFYREVELTIRDSEDERDILKKVYKTDENGNIWYEDDNGFFVIAEVQNGPITYPEKQYSKAIHPILVNKHHWVHPHQDIRNPKFSYNRIYNVLTLTLSQMDTLTHFKPTDWYYHEEDEDKPKMPYWKNNPSLVMIEVKIRVRNNLEHHWRDEVIIRPQEYWAVADTIEHSLMKPKKHVNTYDPRRGADPIYVPHRFRYFYGDYAVNSAIRDLPDRLEDLPYSRQIAEEILLRDGLVVRSFPQYKLFDSEGNELPDDSMYTDSEGEYREVSRYFCVMIPLHIKVKIKNIRVLFGGSPGIMDHVDYDTTGLTWDSEGQVWRDNAGIPTQPRVIPSYLRYPDHEFDNEGNSEFDGSIEYWDERHLFPKYQAPWRRETVYFNSNYVIDPDGTSPENPMGEYICWYICTRETVSGRISRYFGPRKYRDNQRKTPYYEFLIQFEKVGKAN